MKTILIQGAMESEVEPYLNHFKNLKKQFGNTRVLHGIDFSMEKGEVVAVIGSSGGREGSSLGAGSVVPPVLPVSAGGVTGLPAGLPAVPTRMISSRAR